MIDNAVAAAEKAFEVYSELSPERIAEFLERIAKEVTALGDALITTAAQETGLTADRLTGERARTVNQLLLFADVARRKHGRMFESTLRCPIGSPCLALICAAR